MNDKVKKNYRCFGKLEAVFPKGAEGLRMTPEKCSPCPDKTACLRIAMEGTEGLAVREEVIDRAYSSGLISFWERWSKKKDFQRRISTTRRRRPRDEGHGPSKKPRPKSEN